jgi:hypothetical protein
MHTIHKKNGRVGEAVPGGFAGGDEFFDLCVFFWLADLVR